jgi:hypothetical protein
MLPAQPNRILHKGRAKSEQVHNLELNSWAIIIHLTTSNKTLSKLNLAAPFKGTFV